MSKDIYEEWRSILTEEIRLQIAEEFFDEFLEYRNNRKIIKKMFLNFLIRKGVVFTKTEGDIIVNTIMNWIDEMDNI
jgi:hypothetical protein